MSCAGLGRSECRVTETGDRTPPAIETNGPSLLGKSKSVDLLGKGRLSCAALD